jgi:DNA-binding PadR family transcriptional regulator
MPRPPHSSPQTRRLLDALFALPASWRHGYDLSKETRLKSGTLYPILMRLEADGLLETRWEEAPDPGRPSRHLYRLTVSGIAVARAARIQHRLAGLDASSAPRPATGMA